jgi:aromatic amino acid aminotransferase I
MSAARKQEIYDICVKYDVIICEDDPYYFLQAGPYVHQHLRITATESDDQFLASLVPSFLAFDKFGYVVRIDTFSKTICPGSRLGWITSNPLFGERLLRAFESNYQAPW